MYSTWEPTNRVVQNDTTVKNQNPSGESVSIYPWISATKKKYSKKIIFRGGTGWISLPHPLNWKNMGFFQIFH